MSQSPNASANGSTTDPSSGQVRRINSERTIRALLEALDDPACRDIIDATSDSSLSAREISETCDLPLSTTYRKLDLLTDAGLLTEKTRIRRSGKHASEYSALVEDVVISLPPNGEMELQVSPSESPGQAESILSVTGE